MISAISVDTSLSVVAGGVVLLVGGTCALLMQGSSVFHEEQKARMWNRVLLRAPPASLSTPIKCLQNPHFYCTLSSLYFIYLFCRQWSMRRA